MFRLYLRCSVIIMENLGKENFLFHITATNDEIATGIVILSGGMHLIIIRPLINDFLRKMAKFYP